MAGAYARRRCTARCMACLEESSRPERVGPAAGSPSAEKEVSCPRQRSPILQRPVPDLKPVITTSRYDDPGCPWAYSANPAFRVLEWRYGAQLDWRLVLIGLTESADQYVARGSRRFEARSARRGSAVRDAFLAFTEGACERDRARMPGGRGGASPTGSEWRVFRALQFANFTSPIVLEDEQAIAAVLDRVEGVDAPAIVSLLDDPAVTDAYEHDRAETRAAAGSAAELQGKTAQTDGPVRFTAPSIIFERDGRQLVAGGWQTVEAYDLLVVI